jgi:hypothetical protein
MKSRETRERETHLVRPQSSHNHPQMLTSPSAPQHLFTAARSVDATPQPAPSSPSAAFSSSPPLPCTRPPFSASLPCYRDEADGIATAVLTQIPATSRTVGPCAPPGHDDDATCTRPLVRRVPRISVLTPPWHLHIPHPPTTHCGS